MDFESGKGIEETIQFKERKSWNKDKNVEFAKNYSQIVAKKRTHDDMEKESESKESKKRSKLKN